MVTITIDNQRIAVDGRLTILEAAKTAHIEIPHLCYLKGINDIGACRICAVELEGKDRLVTASAAFTARLRMRLLFAQRLLRFADSEQ